MGDHHFEVQATACQRFYAMLVLQGFREFVFDRLPNVIFDYGQFVLERIQRKIRDSQLPRMNIDDRDFVVFERKGGLIFSVLLWGLLCIG